MKLIEVMSPVSIFFKPSDTLLSVAEAMVEKHHSCGLICEYDKPMGIITERDILRIFTAQAPDNLNIETQVKSVMTRQPVCVNGDTELVDALDLANNHNLRHLPVVDSTHKLIGIVTLSDMVKAHLGSIEMDEDLRDKSQKLHVLSIEDPLTGLPNKRAMERDVRHAAAVSLRKSEPYSIAMIDVDYFSNYNDHYGLQAGDDALVHIAEIMKKNLRDSDRIFRYSGQAFLFLMPLTPVDGGMVATRRIREAIANSNYSHEKSPLKFLTVSIGVTAGYDDNWKAVVEQAESALYDAKEDGRNIVCMIEPTPQTEFWDLSQRASAEEPIDD